MVNSGCWNFYHVNCQKNGSLLCVLGLPIDVLGGVEAWCFAHLVILIISDGFELWTTDLRHFGGDRMNKWKKKHSFIPCHLVAQFHSLFLLRIVYNS